MVEVSMHAFIGPSEMATNQSRDESKDETIDRISSQQVDSQPLVAPAPKPRTPEACSWKYSRKCLLTSSRSLAGCLAGLPDVENHVTEGGVVAEAVVPATRSEINSGREARGEDGLVSCAINCSIIQPRLSHIPGLVASLAESSGLAWPSRFHTYALATCPAGTFGILPSSTASKYLVVQNAHKDQSLAPQALSSLYFFIIRPLLSRSSWSPNVTHRTESGRGREGGE